MKEYITLRISRALCDALADHVPSYLRTRSARVAYFLERAIAESRAPANKPPLVRLGPGGDYTADIIEEDENESDQP